VDFARLSEVQAIIAAEAGEAASETARPESTAAATSILI